MCDEASMDIYAESCTLQENFVFLTLSYAYVATTVYSYPHTSLQWLGQLNIVYIF